MITTRRGRAKKRRAEEEEPEADPTDALVRTTAALKDAHAAARKAEKQTLAKETEAAALKAERDALATRCAFLESESADAQKAVQSAQAEKRRPPPHLSSSSRRPTRRGEKPRRSSRPTAGPWMRPCVASRP